MSETYNYEEGAIHYDHKKVIHIDTIGSNDIGKVIKAFFDDEAVDAEVEEEKDAILHSYETVDPVKAFVDRVKLIMLKAEKENGKEKPLTARGNGGTYTYQVEGQLFGKVMDELQQYYEDTIEDYLEGADAKRAVSIKFVSPFLGAVLETHLFTPAQMPKKDLEPALNEVYGEGSSAATKLGTTNLSQSGLMLIENMKSVTEKLKKSLKNF